MSNPYIYVVDDTGNSELKKFDYSGNELGTEAIPGSLSWTQVYQTPQYVYGVDSNRIIHQYSKDSNGGLTENWKINNEPSEHLQATDGGDIIFADQYQIKRFAVSDGSEVWGISLSGDFIIKDSTTLSNNNYLATFEDTANGNHVVREYDSETGSKANEIQTKNSNYGNGISRDDGDNYVVVGNGGDVTKYDPSSGDVIWEVTTGHTYIIKFVRGLNYYYLLTNSGEVYVVNDDGTINWSDTNLTAESIAPYMDSNDNPRLFYHTGYFAETYSLDAETGSQVWQGDPGSHFKAHSTAYPDYSAFPMEWIPTVTLSGTAIQSGSGVQGAEIIVIDNDRDVIADRVTTDSSGNWSTEVRDNTLHVVAQYTDGNGNVYNTESYPNVNSN